MIWDILILTQFKINFDLLYLKLGEDADIKYNLTHKVWYIVYKLFIISL